MASGKCLLLLVAVKKKAIDFFISLGYLRDFLYFDVNSNTFSLDFHSSSKIIESMEINKVMTVDDVALASHDGIFVPIFFLHTI